MDRSIAIAIAAVLVLPQAVTADGIRTTHSAADATAAANWLEQNIQNLVKTYKHLHANPELSLQETKTAALLAEGLSECGYQVSTGVGKTGVVAVLANGDGPTVLIRGDMDALPIIEETGLDYLSKVRVTKGDGTSVGVMHACGHDVHSTMLLGTGQLLSKLRDRWRALYGSEPPRYRRATLLRRLAHRVQELAFGEVSQATRARLRQHFDQVDGEPGANAAAALSERRRQASLPVVGTRLLRSWRGRRYEVTTVAAGFEYEGRCYRSLSAIACEITGTRWNGPAFFGLRNRGRQEKS